MSNPYQDAQKLLVSLMAGPAAFFGLVVAALIAFGYCMGQRTSDAKIVALRDTVRISDSVIVVRTDTVVARQRVVTRWDSVVRTVTDTQVVILRDSLPPDTVTVPLEVIAKDRAKDALIAGLYGRDSTQEWRIATRDKLYTLGLQKANGPRWGYGVTIGYGCGENDCGPQGTVGISYQAPLPDLRRLFLHR